MINFNVCLQELQDEHNRYFESKMADTLIKPLSNLLSIKKVSSAILDFLETNKKSVISRIQNCSKIREELYGEKYYAHLDMTFHETMLVARQVDIPNLIGNYVSGIPESVKQLPEFNDLRKEFSGYLLEESNSSCQIKITK